MALDVISDNGGELADLEGEPAILPRRQSQRIFVQPNCGPVIARVESAIESRLCEEVNLFAELRVEKKRETRIEEFLDLAVDQFRRWLLEMVNFKIDCTAQARSDIVLERRKRQCVIEPVEKVINFERSGIGDEKPKAEHAQQWLHAVLTAAVCCGLRRWKTNFKFRPIIARTD